MRCGLVVDEKEVLAVVLGDIEGSLSAEIKRTLTGTWGKPCQRDFLRPDAGTHVIQRGRSDRKRRCFVFFIKFLPAQLVEDFKNTNTCYLFRFLPHKEKVS